MRMREIMYGSWKHLLKQWEVEKQDVVVTYGDKGMLKAINQVFPDAIHRRCSWHLRINIKAKISNQGFIDELPKFCWC
ncbi:hypothetical protein LINPERHAP2_LOCUS21058 [Linum perenne]